MQTTPEIKAIETVHNGYRFRSRIEARWAVFFDTLGIRYEYEKEGFDLEGLRYLPDFWLPDLNCWFEVKGAQPGYEEMQRSAKLAELSHVRCYLGWGDMNETPKSLLCFAWDEKLQDLRWSDGYAWCECAVCHRVEPYHPSDTGNSFLMHQKCGIRWISEHKDSQSEGPFYDRAFTPRILEAYTAARQARFEFSR